LNDLEGLPPIKLDVHRSKWTCALPQAKGQRMARKTKDAKAKPKERRSKHEPATEATIDEFQQEGMGIAAKE
jgi:hypothetical protein